MSRRACRTRVTGRRSARARKRVVILSGGLRQAVLPLAEVLAIRADVFAVEICPLRPRRQICGLRRAVAVTRGGGKLGVMRLARADRGGVAFVGGSPIWRPRRRAAFRRVWRRGQAARSVRAGGGDLRSRRPRRAVALPGRERRTGSSRAQEFGPRIAAQRATLRFCQKLWIPGPTGALRILAVLAAMIGHRSDAMTKLIERIDHRTALVRARRYGQVRRRCPHDQRHGFDGRFVCSASISACCASPTARSPSAGTRSPGIVGLEAVALKKPKWARQCRRGARPRADQSKVRSTR